MAGLYTAAVSGTPERPIGPYARGPASVRPWDPRSAAIAERVIAIIHRARPDLVVEHIGSSAVPGLPGKGIIDLGTEADPGDIPAITEAMYALGFGPQAGPDAWPPTRPMRTMRPTRPMCPTRPIRAIPGRPLPAQPSEWTPRPGSAVTRDIPFDHDIA